jgi:diguanylate cyclase (GGDEF)-like protein/PAS domain S-box-containing protein
MGIHVDYQVMTLLSVWQRGLAFALLVGAGLAGNYLKYPIFLNIDFLFGSIFAMLALQFFGLWRGLVAATLIAAMTYLLWNHPYAIVIMALEVATVGWLMRQRKIGLVLADGVYWLFIGMPLVYAFYHGVMDVPMTNTTIVMTKQAVNGIANALMARLLFTGFVLATKTGQIAYRDLVYNLLAGFALYPALFLLMVASHSDFLDADQSIRRELRQDTRVIDSHIALWVQDRRTTVVQLAKMAENLSAAQMQAHLEQAHTGDSNFQRISLADKDSITRAFSPLEDEFGMSNIGKNYADRPFIPTLKQTLQPMLSEVVMGRIGHPAPVVSMLAPVVIGGQYSGLIGGSLSLDQLQDHLNKSVEDDGTVFTLLDKNGNVILTNRKGQKVMTTIDRGPGSLNQLDRDLSQWLPSVPPNTPISERWRSSFYVSDTSIGNFAEWHLVLEQPVAPFQKVLYTRYTNQLGLLLLVLLSAMALAEFLSRKVAARTEELSAFTKQLPVDLGMGTQPVWPQSNLTEHDQLISKFRDMAGLLAAQFDANRQLTGSLEQRVVQRTVALANSEEKYRLLIENSHDIIYTLDKDGTFTFVSNAWTELLGHPIGEVMGHAFMPFVHPDDLSVYMASMAEIFQGGRHQHNIEYRVHHADGSWRWHTSNSIPMRDDFGKVIGYEGIASDITERKLAEEQVHQLAFYDVLTKLPNRRLLTDRMSQAMAASKRSACYGALMFIDLDNFKPLNDAYGHGMGDLLLVEVAHRLLACVREVDTVARFGGDEFVVLLGDLDRDKGESTSQARAVAEKIRASLVLPYLLSAQALGSAAPVVEHHCAACIGVVVFVNHEVTPEDALRWADSAMYQAKGKGRNLVQFYGE